MSFCWSSSFSPFRMTAALFKVKKIAMWKDYGKILCIQAKSKDVSSLKCVGYEEAKFEWFHINELNLARLGKFPGERHQLSVRSPLKNKIKQTKRFDSLRAASRSLSFKQQFLSFSLVCLVWKSDAMLKMGETADFLSWPLNILTTAACASVKRRFWSRLNRTIIWINSHSHHFFQRIYQLAELCIQVNDDTVLKKRKNPVKRQVQS